MYPVYLLCKYILQKKNILGDEEILESLKDRRNSELSDFPEENINFQSKEFDNILENIYDFNLDLQSEDDFNEEEHLIKVSSN